MCLSIYGLNFKDLWIYGFVYLCVYGFIGL